MALEFALLLPGQGSQKVGMGKDLYEAFPAARAVYEEVDDAVGIDLSQLAFDGPAEELTLTVNAQPALLAHSAAVWAVVRELLDASTRAAAGHSLGEFTAYHLAGALTLRDAAQLVRRRGALMYDEGLARPGAMAAILGVLSTPIEQLCAQASRETAMVVPANYNSAEQIVISGERAGVVRAMELAKDAGAKRCQLLPVSGAFHSPLMAPAIGGLEAALARIEMRDPRFPIIANVDASPVSDASRARDMLVDQLTAPVQWRRVMERLVTTAPNALFVEIGSGAVLTGLAKRIAPQARTIACGTVADIEQLARTINEGGMDG